MADDLTYHEKRIRDMWLGGASRKQICNTLDVSDAHLSDVTKRLNLPIRWINPRNVTEDDQVAKLIASGKGIREISREMKVDNKVVRRRMKKLGLKSPNKPGKQFDDKTQSYLDDWEAGMSYADIARKYGITPPSARAAVLRRKNLKESE